MTCDTGLPRSAVVGVLGGGQLGRMMALAAANLGVRMKCLDPAPDAPASWIASQRLGHFRDAQAIKDFASQVGQVLAMHAADRCYCSVKLGHFWDAQDVEDLCLRWVRCLPCMRLVGRVLMRCMLPGLWLIRTHVYKLFFMEQVSPLVKGAHDCGKIVGSRRFTALVAMEAFWCRKPSCVG
eukprot:1158599-Pelagomonas_calceolata.AAC.10